METPLIKQKISEKKEVMMQMRTLLLAYPAQIVFKGFQDYQDVIHNLLLIEDLLLFCKFRTNQEDIEKRIDQELEEIRSMVNTNKVRDLYFKYTPIKGFGKKKIFAMILEIIGPSLQKVTEKIQYYYLAIPPRDKKKVFVRTAHGLPAGSAEDYEQEEIEKGMNVDPSKGFKIDEEGEVKPLE